MSTPEGWGSCVEGQPRKEDIFITGVQGVDVVPCSSITILVGDVCLSSESTVIKVVPERLITCGHLTHEP